MGELKSGFDESWTKEETAKRRPDYRVDMSQYLAVIKH